MEKYKEYFVSQKDLNYVYLESADIKWGISETWRN
ncbi:hypothetical protein IIS_05181 [Bacillus cereus VD131]|nr:hypothetical protein IIS_05181 [Bacillus cereus VD131]MCS3599232.1 hypothetical protein [Bacillus sp. JUb91]